MKKILLFCLMALMAFGAKAQIVQLKGLDLTDDEKEVYQSMRGNPYSPQNIAIGDSVYIASEAKGHTDAMVMALMMKSVPYVAMGDSSCLPFLDEAMALCRKTSKTEAYFTLFALKTLVYSIVDDNTSMMASAKAMIADAVEMKSDGGLYLSYQAMGNAFVYRDNPRLARIYYRQAVDYGQKIEGENYWTNYMHLANCYDAMQMMDSADYYMNLCIKMAQENSDVLHSQVVEYMHFVIGDILEPQDYLRKYDSLISIFDYESFVDPDQIYMARAKYFAYKDNRDSALYYASISERGVNALNTQEMIYKIFGDWENAYNCRYDADMIHDSLQAVIQSEDFSSMDAQLGNVQLRLESERLQYRNRMMLIVSIFVVLMVIVITVVLVIVSRQRTLREQKVWLEAEVKRQTAEIVEKSEEIQTQAEEIMLQSEEIKAQRDNLEKVNSDITSSIKYAKRMQTAAVPSADTMASLFGDYFVMWRPLNIVSGDFYWATQVGDRKLITVADCTGHGVPGAFVCMLGISILNDMVKNLNAQTKASDCLNEMRQNIIKSLNQSVSEGSSQDGMDMAFCIIDSKSGKLQYSGAHRPLILVRDGQVTEIKSDRMPVGIYVINTEFTNHEIDIAPGDWIYMFSDGITDQFGMEPGDDKPRKFTQRRLVKLLADNSAQSSEKQKLAVEQALDTWMNSSSGIQEQLDDQLIVGVRL